MRMPSALDLCESTPTCHSEGAERPKHLLGTRKNKALRFTQDDKMAFRRGLNFEFLSLFRTLAAGR